MRIPEGPIVFALGGNAITLPSEEGNIGQQFEHTRQTAAAIVECIDAQRPVVITHGNGPQVGSELRRVELAAREVYTIPLDVCVADTQGGMGYMIAQCLTNALRARGISRDVGAIVTRVEIDPADPAMTDPQKPIGPFYDAARAAQLAAAGWVLREAPGQGFRRVAPSPRPLAVPELPLVQTLVAAGQIVIAAGGGGVPVVRGTDGGYRGVPAVVDKDRTSALLATAIGAAAIVLVTSVECVCVDYGRATQRALPHMSVTEARRLLAAGQFPAGSMGPKIESAIAFLESSPRPDAVVIICSAENLARACEGQAGTWIARI